ncbi:shadow of prion protein 2 [Salminus brasiliensis]|uniref:shadow of prion protein 2 n=1 Tax=Salminus brasiliensis TaxID=930266 RepID=UPI003B830528
MLGRRTLTLVCVWMLLVASFCPWASGKRGGVFRGRGKGVGMGSKTPPTQNKGSSKQGLKLAGAAAAGAIGGAAIGYGLGSLGRPRYGHGYGYGYDDSSEEDRRYYHPDGPGYHNRSDWRYYKGGGSSGPALDTLLMLGVALSVFMLG